MNRKNFTLLIEYDGTAYYGWQRQKTDRTIQGEIENALSTMTGQPIVLIGSGRTDAGVHAKGQVANFLCNTNLTQEIFQKGLNSLLQKDIVIKKCLQVDEAFHARFDAKSKKYQYRILNQDLPKAIGRQYFWFVRKKLNIISMQKALKHIIGPHDFKAFEGTGSPRAHTIRNVMNASISECRKGEILFEIIADGFLRYMVRNLTGTLVNVGHGKTTPEEFKTILELKDRSMAGATAPPHGLWLMEVKY